VTKAQPANKATIIRLTRLKQWYIPADTESYLVLRKAGIPLLRIHRDFLPTVGLLTKKYNIKAKEVNFKTGILDPFLDKVGSSWLRKDNRMCAINATNMRFDAVKPESFDEAKETIPKLQKVLEDFFTRWGYGFRFELSQVKSRVRLNVEYWLDAEKLPIIPIAQDVAELPRIKLKLGFTRITMSFGDKYVDTLIEISQGGVFKPLHTSQCLYSQISSVKPLIVALCNVPSKDTHNSDNPVD
jgi:hypothetical protein